MKLRKSRGFPNARQAYEFNEFYENPRSKDLPRPNSCSIQQCWSKCMAWKYGVICKTRRAKCKLTKFKLSATKHSHKGNLPVKCNTSFAKNILCLIQLTRKKRSYRAQKPWSYHLYSFQHNMIDFILPVFSSRTRQLFYSAVALRSVTSLCSVNIAAFKDIELLILNGHIFMNLEAR